MKPIAMQLTRCAALMLLGAATVGSGCSGINATKSISPLDFILPGLLENDRPAPLLPDTTNTLVCCHFPSDATH